MNGTTKQRYISTSIWDDDWFDSLSEREKLVYFYLLTNTHTNPAGVYQCTLKNIRLEIGLDREETERIMDKFSADGKAFYYKDYIIIPKWLKHQKIGDRSKLFLGAVKVLKSLPDDVIKFISDRRHYDYDLSSIFGKNGIVYNENTQNNDSLSQNTDNLSIAYQNNGITYTKNDTFSPHEFDLDLDVDFDSDIDIDSDVDVDNKQKKQSSSVENPQTTTTEHNIKNIAKELGFFLTSKQAKEFLRLDNKMLIGEHNFLVFAAERIREDTTKSRGDHERIFSKAWNYQNLIQEYPDWLKKQKIKAEANKLKQQKDKEEKERKRKIKTAFENKPTVCSHCGAPITVQGEREQCAVCGWLCQFNEEKMVWEFFEMASLSEQFKNMIRDKNGNVSELPVEKTKTEDIDF